MIGRKNTLMIGAFLKIVTGLVYASSTNIVVLIVMGIIGVISVTGTEIGPFLPIEQSVLTQIIEECSETRKEVPKNISRIFGYYNLFGFISEAVGAAFAGFIFSILQRDTEWT